jgi:hypothetical protein
MFRQILFGAVAALAIVADTPASVTRSPVCGPPSAASDFAINELRAYAVSTAPTVVDVRARYGLGAVSADSIALVSVDSICARAGTAVDSVEQFTLPNRQVYVYRFGSHRVVDWVRSTRGHARAGYVFDSAWVYKGPLGLTVVD